MGLKVKISKFNRVVINLRADYSMGDLLKGVDKMSICLCKIAQRCTLRKAMSSFIKCQLYESELIGHHKVPWTIPLQEIINMRKVLKEEGIRKQQTDDVDGFPFESE